MDEDDKGKDRPRYNLLGIDSKIKFRLDEQLADLRDWWEQWSAEERNAFKTWVDRIVEIQETQPQLDPYVSLRLEFSEPIGDEGEFHSFSPPIGTVKKAMEHWERGEPFAPNSMGDMV